MTTEQLIQDAPVYILGLFFLFMALASLTH